ncbi:MAG: phosphate ABC transporter permease subunit PstC [Limisphaerales bacterium]
MDKKKLIERGVEALVYLSSWVSILGIVFLFVFIGKEAFPLLTDPRMKEEVQLSQLWSAIWQPVSDQPKFGLIPLFIGTLKASFVAMLFATPLAILAAVFTSEFAPPRLGRTIKPVVELLAGIPSVVLGFFALVVLATWVQELFGFTMRLNATAAGVALGLAVLPIIYTVTEDALATVPKAFREASLSLGASSWQTAFKVVLPAALPGIFAALVLGFGRAVGETMIVLMASGNASIVSASLGDSIRTLSATIAAELAEVVFGDGHYRLLFGLGVILFSFTFVLNLVGSWYIQRVKKRLLGAA